MSNRINKLFIRSKSKKAELVNKYCAILQVYTYLNADTHESYIRGYMHEVGFNGVVRVKDDFGYHNLRASEEEHPSMKDLEEIREEALRNKEAQEYWASVEADELI